MIGFAVFGLLMFYFSLYYKPLRLLDRLLSNIISEMPEAIFVFDPNGKCIWVNDHALKLTGIDEQNLDLAAGKLIAMFGGPGDSSDESVVERIVGSGSSARYYTMKEHKVTDEKEKLAGSYLRIRDVTEEKLRIKREMLLQSIMSMRPSSQACIIS